MSHFPICLKKKMPRELMLVQFDRQCCRGAVGGPWSSLVTAESRRYPSPGLSPACPGHQRTRTSPPSLPCFGQGCLCCPQAPRYVPTERLLQQGWDPHGDGSAGTSLLGAKARCLLAPPTSGCSWVWPVGHRGVMGASGDAVGQPRGGVSNPDR